MFPFLYRTCVVPVSVNVPPDSSIDSCFFFEDYLMKILVALCFSYNWPGSAGLIVEFVSVDATYGTYVSYFLLF